MSEPDEHPILVAVATTIADGNPVDWESLLTEHPDLREELEELRVLQRVEVTSSRAGEVPDRNG